MDDCPKRSRVVRDLPEDSLVEILARVPARSLCRSKCVAKAWRDVIEDPFHRKKLPQTLQGFFLITKVVYGLHIRYASLLARSTSLRIGPSRSFLMRMRLLPGFEMLNFSDSCNGVLLFEHTSESLSLVGYVVCNPTTKQWAEVPPPPSSLMYETGPMHLVFDPAVSSHFHLVQFVWGLEELEDEGFVMDADEDDDYHDGEEENGGYVHDYQGHLHQQRENDDNDDDDDDDDDSDDDVELFQSVNVYSSESGQWIHIESAWDKHNLEGCRLLGSSSAVLNGMLHFIISDNHKVQIAAVDVQGVLSRKFIPVPITAGTKHWQESRYVAQSQGCLHYIYKTADAQLSIWVLDNYNTQKWVLKHSVSFMEMFGKLSHRQSPAGHENDDFSVVAMHPDGNVVFVVQDWNRKLISYDMDHKLVSVIGTLENVPSTIDVVPYVPCFLESPALTNKH